MMRRLKCLLGFHEWEWKRIPLRSTVGTEVGWAELNICKHCGKKE